MDETAAVTTHGRRTPAEIEQIVAGFADSGLHRSEFCRRHAMSLGTLNRYLQRLRQDGGDDTANDGLVAVELVGAKRTRECDSGCGLTLVLSRGHRIEVEKGFDGPTLERLIKLLEQM